MSLMQKAIRRGDPINAISGGFFYLRNNERGFWKRLCICAIEDIGIANLELVAQVHIAAGSKRLRSSIGGCDRTACALISALCASSKDRATDDLFDILSRVPILNDMKADFAERSHIDLLDDVNQLRNPIIHRTIAAVQLATGWDGFDAYLPKYNNWFGVISSITEEVASPCVVAASNLGIKRTGLVLAPFLVLLNGHKQACLQTVDDAFPKAVDIDGLPSWALGGHTRCGLDSFRRYVACSNKMYGLIKRTSTKEVSPAQIIAGLIFRLESGQLANRMDWDVGRSLKEQATQCGWGIPDDVVPEDLSILINELDILNECRVTAMRHYLR